jgi:acyl carrier protein
LGEVGAILAAINARRRVRRGATLMLPEPPVAPRTPVEETLCDIWTEVLGVEPVGIHDNFFQLGGDSLLATQVVSRLRRAFCVQLPLGILFDVPTVAGLAMATLQAMTERVNGDDMIDLLDELERVGDGGLIGTAGGAGVTATP